MKVVYLDHNSTTIPVHFNHPLQKLPLNPSSTHRFGQEGRKITENARQQILNAVNANNNRTLIFTSCATESNNMALKSDDFDIVLASNIEHYSILECLPYGGLIPVNPDGVVNLGDLEKLLQQHSHHKKKLVSVMLVNNETGIIQPIKEIARIAHHYNAVVHTDAVQGFGKVPIDIEDLNVDMISLSGHKIGAPHGVGALIFRNNISMRPIMRGGGQEYRLRPGSLNVWAIHNFGILSSVIQSRVGIMDTRIRKLRDNLESKLNKLYPALEIVGKDAPRVSNTSSIIVPNIKSETQVMHYDMHNIAISAGSACSSGQTRMPLVHMAMGYPKEIAECAIRISLGVQNTNSDTKAFYNAFTNLLQNHHLI